MPSSLEYVYLLESQQTFHNISTSWHPSPDEAKLFVHGLADTRIHSPDAALHATLEIPGVGRILGHRSRNSPINSLTFLCVMQFLTF